MTYNEHLILTRLCKLLINQRDLDIAIDCYSKNKSSRIVEIATKHKVVTILYTNLKKLIDMGYIQSNNDVIKSCEIAYKKSIDHKNVLVDELLKLNDSIADKTSAGFLLLKGISIDRFYPDGYVRWMGDIDLIFKTMDDAIIIHNDLLDRGYHFDEFEFSWLKYDIRVSSRHYGQIFLMKRDNNDFGRFDVHYGPYSVGYNGWIEVDLDKYKEIHTFKGFTFNVLNATGSVILLLAHVISHGYITIKDVNDFVALILSQKVDWKEILEISKHHHFESILYRITDHIHKLYKHSLITEICRIIMNNIVYPNSSFLWSLYHLSRLQRSIVNCIFAYKFNRNTDRSSISQSLLIALQCFIYYHRNMNLKFDKRNLLEDILSKICNHNIINGLNSEYCISLVPIYKTTTNSYNIELIIDKIKNTSPKEWIFYKKNQNYWIILGDKVKLIALGDIIYIGTLDLILGNTLPQIRSDIELILHENPKNINKPRYK